MRRSIELECQFAERIEKICRVMKEQKNSAESEQLLRALEQVLQEYLCYRKRVGSLSK